MDEKELEINNEVADVKDIRVEDGSFTPEVPDTVEIPIIENPDDREYEDVEIEVEGGV